MGILNYKKDNLKTKLGSMNEEKRVDNLIQLRKQKVAEAKKKIGGKGRK